MPTRGGARLERGAIRTIADDIESDVSRQVRERVDQEFDALLRHEATNEQQATTARDRRHPV